MSFVRVRPSRALADDNLDPPVLRAPLGIIGPVGLRVMGDGLRLPPATREDVRAGQIGDVGGVLYDSTRPTDAVWLGREDSR